MGCFKMTLHLSILNGMKYKGWVEAYGMLAYWMNKVNIPAIKAMTTINHFIERMQMNFNSFFASCVTLSNLYIKYPNYFNCSWKITIKTIVVLCSGRNPIW